MKYATWNLHFAKPNYGTGPEAEIASQGFTCEGAFLHGEVKGGTIIGYFTGNPVELQTWNFQELTQSEALEFVLQINSTATVYADGKIIVEVQGE